MTQIMWVESRETVETTAFPVVKFCLLIPLVVYLVGLGYFCGSAAVLAEILNEGKGFPVNDSGVGVRKHFPFFF